MKILFTAVAAIIMMSITTSVYASSFDFVFQKPALFKGTGCTAGGALDITGPVKVTGVNTSILSIFFEGYDAGKDAASGKSRSACSFAIPIQVTHGFQIANVTVDWDIYVKGKGELKRKFFLSGRPLKLWRASNFHQADGGTLTVHDNVTNKSLTTDCNGGVYTIRVNSQVKVKDEKSYIGVSPNDGHSRVTFKVKLKTC